MAMKTGVSRPPKKRKTWRSDPPKPRINPPIKKAPTVASSGQRWSVGVDEAGNTVWGSREEHNAILASLKDPTITPERQRELGGAAPLEQDQTRIPQETVEPEPQQALGVAATQGLREQVQKEELLAQQAEQVQPLIEKGEAEIATVQEQILNQPSLEPESSVVETVAQVGLTQGDWIMSKLRGEEPSPEFVRALSETPLGKAIGGGILAAEAIAVATAGWAVSAAVAQAITAKAIGGLALTSFGAGGALLSLTGVGAITSAPTRGRMATERTVVQKMVEEGEKMEASVRNGAPISDTLQVLTQMSDDIEEAERVLKQRGQYDVGYRLSASYKADMALMRTARHSIKRRMEAVVNIAKTGTAAVNPEALMLLAADMAEDIEFYNNVKGG